MGKDKQPKIRQKIVFQRKQGKREIHRVLIICEGSKTEPLYLGEIRKACRISTSIIKILPSQLGTAPIQIVDYAVSLFDVGDTHQAIMPKAFDYIYVVFDRDDHLSYFDAIQRAKALNDKFKNDDGDQVKFISIVSVPCFELWLLLHYEEIIAPMHRQEVLKRLKKHIPNYSKGLQGLYNLTRPLIEQAKKRSRKLVKSHSPLDGEKPYTDISTLVDHLISLSV